MYSIIMSITLRWWFKILLSLRTRKMSGSGSVISVWYTLTLWNTSIKRRTVVCFSDDFNSDHRKSTKNRNCLRFKFFQWHRSRTVSLLLPVDKLQVYPSVVYYKRRAPKLERPRRPGGRVGYPRRVNLTRIKMLISPTPILRCRWRRENKTNKRRENK